VVSDIMEGAYASSSGSSAKRYASVAEEIIEYGSLSPAALQKKIKALEKKMHQHARDLEFEEAACVRDEIHKVKKANMGLVH